MHSVSRWQQPPAASCAERRRIERHRATPSICSSSDAGSAVADSSWQKAGAAGKRHQPKALPRSPPGDRHWYLHHRQPALYARLGRWMSQSHGPGRPACADLVSRRKEHAKNCVSPSRQLFSRWGTFDNGCCGPAAPMANDRRYLSSRWHPPSCSVSGIRRRTIYRYRQEGAADAVHSLQRECNVLFVDVSPFNVSRKISVLWRIDGKRSVSGAWWFAPTGGGVGSWSRGQAIRFIKSLVDRKTLQSRSLHRRAIH